LRYPFHVGRAGMVLLWVERCSAGTVPSVLGPYCLIKNVWSVLT